MGSKVKFLFFFLVIVAISGCKKEDDSPRETITVEGSDLLVWEDTFQDNGVYETSEKYIVEDDIIFIKHRNNNTPGVVISRDIRTGTINWIWDDWPADLHDGSKRISHSFIDDNELLFSSPRGGVYLIDTRSGQTIWQTNTTEFQVLDPFEDVFIWNNLYLFVANISNESEQLHGKIVQAWNSKTDKIETLFYGENESLIETTIGKPAFEVNSESDTIIYFQLSEARQLADFIAFNLTKDSILWQRFGGGIQPVRERVSHNSPIVTKRSVIFVSNEGVYAYNKESGDRIWGNNYNDDYNEVHHFTSGGILFCSIGPHLRALDMTKGNLLWYKRSGTSPEYYGIQLGRNHIIENSKLTSTYLLNKTSGFHDFKIINHLDQFLYYPPLYSTDNRYIVGSYRTVDFCYENPVYR